MILLLIVIYITFISLGLPDSLFGVAWPLIHIDFEVPENFGSIFSIIVGVATGGTSFFAGPLIRKFGTGWVTAVSVLLTAVGLLGIGLSPNIFVLVLFAIISSLGAGAIDTGLNNFVSLHYKSRHMNWLHCFWGVGVTASPMIMSYFLRSADWQGGYRAVSYIQFGIAIIVFLSLFLWKKHDTDRNQPDATQTDEEKPKITMGQVFRTKGVLFAVVTLGLYCAMEFLLGTWGASYLVNARSFTADHAALFVSLYYGGIMVGRFLAGLVSSRLGDNTLIRAGILLSAVGMVVLCFAPDVCALIGYLMIGLGFAPVFPSALHAVPARFGKDLSADITGVQMAGAYLIGFLFQLAFGFVAVATTFNITPYVLLAVSALLALFNEITIAKTSHKLPT